MLHIVHIRGDGDLIPGAFVRLDCCSCNLLISGICTISTAAGGLLYTSVLNPVILKPVYLYLYLSQTSCHCLYIADYNIAMLNVA